MGHKVARSNLVQSLMLFFPAPDGRGGDDGTALNQQEQQQEKGPSIDSSYADEE